MRRCESVTGHIRCPICRTRLLAGRFDATGVIQAQATCRRLDDCARLLAGRLRTEDVAAHAVARLKRAVPMSKAGHRAPRPDYEPAFRRASLQAGLPSGRRAFRLDCNRAIGPSGPIISPPLGGLAFRPDHLSGLQAGLTQVLAPPCRRRRRRSVAASRSDDIPMPPLVGAGNLSRLAGRAFEWTGRAGAGNLRDGIGWGFAETGRWSRRGQDAPESGRVRVTVAVPAELG